MEKKYNGSSKSRILAIESLYLFAAKAITYSFMLNFDKAVKYWSKSSAAVAFLAGKRV